MDFRSQRLELGVAPATVNKDLRQIKSALSYAVDAGLLRANPLLRWKQMMLREPDKQTRVIESNEFAKLLGSLIAPSMISGGASAHWPSGRALISTPSKTWAGGRLFLLWRSITLAT